MIEKAARQLGGARIRAVLLIADDPPLSPCMDILYDLYLVAGMAKSVCRNAQSGERAIAMPVAKRLRACEVKQARRACCMYVSWWCRKGSRCSCLMQHTPTPPALGVLVVALYRITASSCRWYDEKSHHRSTTSHRPCLSTRSTKEEPHTPSMRKGTPRNRCIREERCVRCSQSPCKSCGGHS